VADQLLQEADRDPGLRGQRMRKLGLAIIESLVQIVPMAPAPAAEGFDIRTGQASAIRGGPAFLGNHGRGLHLDELRREVPHRVAGVRSSALSASGKRELKRSGAAEQISLISTRILSSTDHKTHKIEKHENED